MSRRMKTHGDRLREKWAAERQARDAERQLRDDKRARLAALQARIAARDAPGRLVAAKTPRAASSSPASGLGPNVGSDPSNTEPTNAKMGESGEDSTTIVAYGIDTISLSVRGELPESLLVCLGWAKEQAQHSPTRKELSPLPPFLGENLLLGAMGTRGYDFLASSDDLKVTIKGLGGLPLPTMVIRISAACLWREGGGGWGAIDAAADWARLVLGNGCTITVKECHIAGDVQGWVPTVADLRGVVKRADGMAVYNDRGALSEEDGIAYHLGAGDAVESIAAGRSSRVRANIYDKTVEIQKRQKDWLRGVWQQHENYDSSLPVWRVEFQYGREHLHKHHIENLADLRRHQDALYRYGLNWFSWRAPQETDRHRHRWPIIGAWHALARCTRGGAQPLPHARVMRPSLVRLARGGCGYLTSFMALAGEESLESAVGAMVVMLRADGEERVFSALARKRQRYATNGDGDRRLAAARAAVLA